jgi:hypothetical protein
MAEIQKTNRSDFIYVSLLRDRGTVISYIAAERDGGPRKAYRVQSRSLIDGGAIMVAPCIHRNKLLVRAPEARRKAPMRGRQFLAPAGRAHQFRCIKVAEKKKTAARRDARRSPRARREFEPGADGQALSRIRSMCTAGHSLRNDPARLAYPTLRR